MAWLKKTVGKKTATRTPSRSRAKQRVGDVYRLDLNLLGTKPPIKRRFEVPGDMSLGDVHDVLQIIMGWENGHMHQFTARDGTRYGMLPGGDSSLDEDFADESGVKLNAVVAKKGDRLLYEYDFGDGWEHELKVVSVSPPEQGVRYPRCVDGKLACPPEDCGGVWGYYNLLEAIADPKHPEHDDLLEWVGEFDAEAFDLEAINRTFRSFE